jgi:sarcosine oxidase
MEKINVKHVIVGAGAMGSAAAYHLARRGEPLVLIEQFALGHDRGSSHGAARITRHSYADLAYARLMPAAFHAWKMLEADAAEALYVRTGGVSFSPPLVDYAARVAASLAELAVPCWRGSGREWNERHPVFHLPASYDVVFEPDAGMLRAARALAVEVELARHHGGPRTRVVAESAVKRIDREGSRPVVVTDSVAYTAERVVVAAGAWVKRLLPELAAPLRPTLQRVLYLRAADGAPFGVGRFPVFIFKGAGADDAFYGMPEFLGLGVKVARHGGPELDPDRDNRSIDADDIAVVRRFLREHIPSLADAPVDFAETCLYTVAPDDQFVVGFLPGRSDVIVASPCSGHGFKFSCLIGRVLADLAVTGETDVAITSWAPSAS